MALTFFYSFGDPMPPDQMNTIIAEINNNGALIATAIANITAIQAKTNAFAPTLGSGLSINVKGGLLKRVSDGTLLNIADQTVFVSPSVTNQYLYIDNTGVGRVSATLPRESYDVGLYTSNATNVNSITDTRSNAYEIKQRQNRRIIQANKTTPIQSVPGDGVSRVISGWRTDQSWQINEGGVLAGTGVITIARKTEYTLFARAALESATATNLSAKLSLYVNNVEVRILDAQPSNTSALLCILQGTHTDIFNVGDLVDLRINLGSGTGVNINANNNTELIVSMLG